MPEVINGTKVKVHYTGKLSDGSVFDTSREREPLEFTVGSGQVIKGFEDAVIGMNQGDTKTVTIKPNEAYGEYRDDMVVTVGKDQFPDDIDPKVGEQLQIKQKDGQEFLVRIKEINENNVTLDANHPLAGHDLIFEIELVEMV